MTPEAAIYQWMNGFSIPAYPSSSVPDKAEFPYITYDLVLGDWGDVEVNMPVNIYYRGTSEAAPNAKVRDIRNALKFGGVTIPCDNGAIWLKQGSPWAQAVMVDEQDEMVKQRYVNINVEYFLND